MGGGGNGEEGGGGLEHGLPGQEGGPRHQGDPHLEVPGNQRGSNMVYLARREGLSTKGTLTWKLQVIRGVLTWSTWQGGRASPPRLWFWFRSGLKNPIDFIEKSTVPNY